MQQQGPRKSSLIGAGEPREVVDDFGAVLKRALVVIVKHIEHRGLRAASGNPALYDLMRVTLMALGPVIAYIEAQEDEG